MRRLLAIVLGGLLVAAVAALAWPASTRPIRGLHGEKLPGSIAALERVELGGVVQWILIRGRDRTAPLLVFLHGGPGMPAMFLAHAVGAPLEARFVVVHWDQRGAGKSFRTDLPPDSLSVETILADAEELIERLRRRFAKQRVFLVGHSWGSYLGMILAHRRPELVQAFVGVGQTTHAQRQKEIADRFLRRQARETGRLEVLAALDDESFGARERWLFEFGAELHGETSFLPLLLTGLRAPEYTLVDAWNVARGSSFSSTHMRYDALDGELMDSITRLEVPVYFFQGRYDYVTPTELAAEYLDRLQAPRKRLVRFDAAAHFPFFEQPQAFAREMVRVLEESRLQGSPPAPPGSGPGRQDSGTAPP